MSDAQLEEMGPVDYVVIEWDGEQPVTGEVAPLIVDLVDRGLVRILDVGFLAKDLDGTVEALDVDAAIRAQSGLAAFMGASSGLLDEQDLEEAAVALEPGTFAAVLVWENRWAAPLASALRRTGGQLVASGRIPVQSILASLDAGEAVS